MPTETDLFQAAYDAYGPALYRFCLLQMGQAADAEDVLQEVFYKRLYRAPAFATAEHERRWLFRVAVNECRSQRRKGHGNLPLAEDIPAPMGEDLGLWEAVAALPDKLRVAVHLHYAEGYTAGEIGALLGVTASAVKMRLKRGREALRSQWEEDL